MLYSCTHVATVDVKGLTRSHLLGVTSPLHSHQLTYLLRTAEVNYYHLSDE